MNSLYLKGAMLIVAATVCFAFQPIFGYLAYADNTNVYALLWLRFLFATVLLQLYVRLSNKRREPRIAVRAPLLLGIALALTSVCYFSALRYLSVGLTTLLFYLSPLYLYLLAILAGREGVSFVKSSAIAVALYGVFIGAGDLGELSITGLVLGIAAGMCYACYISFSGKHLARVDTVQALTWISTGAFVVMSIPLLAGLAVMPQSSHGYLAALGLCTICTLLSLGLLLKGSHLVKRPTDISVLAMLEIGSTLVLVQLLLDTPIQGYEVLGAVLVFAAAITIFVYGSRQREL